MKNSMILLAKTDNKPRVNKLFPKLMNESIPIIISKPNISDRLELTMSMMINIDDLINTCLRFPKFAK